MLWNGWGKIPCQKHKVKNRGETPRLLVTLLVTQIIITMKPIFNAAFGAIDESLSPAIFRGLM